MAKNQRQRQIVELLQRNRIDSQDQLVDLMEAEGVRTTQSTLSRDLRELGVIKGPQGYRLPDTDPARTEGLRALSESLRARLEAIDVGGNIVVLRCRNVEAAAEVTAEIERASLFQAISALAIGSTVLVIARTPAYARDLTRALRRG